MSYLEVKNLVKYFPVKTGWLSKPKKIHAVQGVSFNIKKGETLGLVGESGCGKTTLGRCLLKLIRPTSGEVIFDGVDVLKIDPSELKDLRRRIQIIFQDPFSSLNPRIPVGKIIEEALIIHKLCKTKKARKDKVVELLEMVGLSTDVSGRYPHEFSGGQRQRVGIARALAVEPEFIVCDEPVSALDVSIQAQIINLLMDLQEKLNLTYLFISHDLKVVEHISHRVAVMYLGKLVEVADCHELYENPKHPYTRALLSAVPLVDQKDKTERIVLEGDLPHPSAPPSGCQFHTRCFMMESICKEKDPALKQLKGKKDHLGACLLVD